VTTARSATALALPLWNSVKRAVPPTKRRKTPSVGTGEAECLRSILLICRRSSVRNVHRLLHRALSDAVAWDYLVFNPAEHASVPSERRRGRNIARPWSVGELAQWLRCAQQDRFAGMWVLAATTGMRRSELLGVRRDSLDLDTGTLTIDETLISVGGRAEESDGKTTA